MVKEVLDEALGLGPLEDLLADDAVSEIMVNARDQIYIEKAGKPQLSPVLFSSEQQMMNIVERIVTPLGRRCDEKSPFRRRPPSGRLARSHHHSAIGPQRADDHHPKIPQEEASARKTSSPGAR